MLGARNWHLVATPTRNQAVFKWCINWLRWVKCIKKYKSHHMIKATENNYGKGYISRTKIDNSFINDIRKGCANRITIDVMEWRLIVLNSLLTSIEFHHFHCLYKNMSIIDVWRCGLTVEKPFRKIIDFEIPLKGRIFKLYMLGYCIFLMRNYK